MGHLGDGPDVRRDVLAGGPVATGRASHQLAVIEKGGVNLADVRGTLRKRPVQGRAAVHFLDGTGEGDLRPWLKAIGPEVPDCNLRLAVGTKACLVARILGLTALFEIYADVESALRMGV